MSELRNQQGKRKIVVVGAGFVGEPRFHYLKLESPPKLTSCYLSRTAGSYIAKALVADSRNQVVLASRHPDKRENWASPGGDEKSDFL